MKFPLVGSFVLFSLFLAFKFLPKDIVNAILSGACLLCCPLERTSSGLLTACATPPAAAYFVFLGMLALVACVEPVASRWVSTWWSEHELEVRLPKVPVVLKVRDGRWVLCSLAKLQLQLHQHAHTHAGAGRPGVQLHAAGAAAGGARLALLHLVLPPQALVRQQCAGPGLQVRACPTAG